MNADGCQLLPVVASGFRWVQMNATRSVPLSTHSASAAVACLKATTVGSHRQRWSGTGCDAGSKRAQNIRVGTCCGAAGKTTVALALRLVFSIWSTRSETSVMIPYIPWRQVASSVRFE